jgi:ribulose-phosphate 3-epimerase
MTSVEIVPAILRTTHEKIVEDWNQVKDAAEHIQLDVADGIFAGDPTFRDIPRFKQLANSEKIELHMMVHTPANFVDDIIDLSPARCVFHLEAFIGTGDIEEVYSRLRGGTAAELGLAINPSTPNQRLEEYLELINYVMFMGINPGWAGQPFKPIVYRKIGAFKDQHPEITIAVDGHVTKETVQPYVKAGARILGTNSAIFKQGNPVENYQQLKLLAQGIS